MPVLMTEQEYFGTWYRYMPVEAMYRALGLLKPVFYPEPGKVFRAFRLTPPERTRVVFIGQDPYPQPGRATGLCFANPAGTGNISASLRILKEAAMDMGKYHCGDLFDITLEDWAAQGVLLLNASLTVEPYRPGSHAPLWNRFTGELLDMFSRDRPGLLYVLFGNHARSFRKYISANSTVMEAAHPSALARRGESLPEGFFRRIDDILTGISGDTVLWYRKQEE